jgi:hypothetical protein
MISTGTYTTYNHPRPVHTRGITGGFPPKCSDGNPQRNVAALLQMGCCSVHDTGA